MIIFNFKIILTFFLLKLLFSVRQEVFTTLQLDMVPGKSVDIADCFSLSFQDETIEGWKCKRCKNYQTAMKSVKLVKLPEMLVVQLKRFNFLLKAEKNCALVTYPVENFQISPAFASESYSLCGIVDHKGDVDGGHYKATCKVGNRWCQFNDQKVTPINTERIVTEENYILFFQRKS